MRCSFHLRDRSTADGRVLAIFAGNVESRARSALDVVQSSFASPLDGTIFSRRVDRRLDLVPDRSFPVFFPAGDRTFHRKMRRPSGGTLADQRSAFQRLTETINVHHFPTFILTSPEFRTVLEFDFGFAHRTLLESRPLRNRNPYEKLRMETFIARRPSPVRHFLRRR